MYVVRYIKEINSFERNRNNMKNDNNTEAPRYSKPQRIAAMIGIIALFGLAITTLVVAIVDKTGRLFQSFLMLTIAAPILMWIYIWLYGKYARSHTIASFDLMGQPDDAENDDSENDDVENNDAKSDNAENDDVENDNANLEKSDK